MYLALIALLAYANGAQLEELNAEPLFERAERQLQTSTLNASTLKLESFSKVAFGSCSQYDEQPQDIWADVSCICPARA